MENRWVIPMKKTLVFLTLVVIIFFTGTIAYHNGSKSKCPFCSIHNTMNDCLFAASSTVPANNGSYVPSLANNAPNLYYSEKITDSGRAPPA